MTTSIRDLIRSDIDRYRFMATSDQTAPLGRLSGPLVTFRVLVMCQGLQASIVYRLGHGLLLWQPRSTLGRFARMAGRVAHFVAGRCVEVTTGISIAERATIGPGLYIGHFGGIIVGAVTIGTNCNLSHGVTLGRSGRIGSYERPIVGDRVWIGPGAVLTGDVRIGDDAVIGANSVVTRPVPARCAAYGVPATILPDTASFGMILYRDAHADIGRAASVSRLADSIAARPAFGADNRVPDQRSTGRHHAPSGSLEI